MSKLSLLVTLCAGLSLAVPAVAKPISCGKDPLGNRKRAAACETLDKGTINILKAAFAACGAYFVEGKELSSLTNKGFTQKRRGMRAIRINPVSEHKMTLAASIIDKRKNPTCIVSISNVTSKDGRELSDVFYGALKPYGFKEGRRRINEHLVEPILLRGGTEWEMEYRIPISTGPVSVAISPPE